MVREGLIIGAYSTEPEFGKHIIREGATIFFDKSDVEGLTEWAEQLKGKVLFLVDDHEGVLKAMAKLLEGKGVKVHTFEKATDALDNMSKIDPDVVLTDINMPGMNGIEFTQKLRVMFPKSTE